MLDPGTILPGPVTVIYQNGQLNALPMPGPDLICYYLSTLCKYRQIYTFTSIYIYTHICIYVYMHTYAHTL